MARHKPVLKPKQAVKGNLKSKNIKPPKKKAHSPQVAKQTAILPRLITKSNVVSGSDSTHRQLLKFKKPEEILHLGNRLFQKEPQILDGVKQAHEFSTTKSERVGSTRQYILSTIEAIVNEDTSGNNNQIDYSNARLPKHWENYISFCDLVYTAQHAHSLNWSTFLLQDYPKKLHLIPDEEEDKENTTMNEIAQDREREDQSKNWKFLPVNKVRKRLKKMLLKSEACEGEDKDTTAPIIASVQTDTVSVQDFSSKNFNDIDVEVDTTDREMLLIRIVTTRRTRNLATDEDKLLTRKPTFFAYFPGEPYFYSTTAKPNPQFCQSLVRCLYCTSYSSIPLADRDVFSLRRLRINRDTLRNNSEIMGTLIDEEMMEYYNAAVRSRYIIDGRRKYNDSPADGDENVNPINQNILPVLTKFELRCKSKFQGDNAAFSALPSEDSSPQNDLSVQIKFSGKNVLAAFAGMANSSVSTEGTKYVETPLPNWLKKSACRGRNFTEIQNRRPKQITNENEIQPDTQCTEDMNDDAMSIAASDVTNWGGRNQTRFHTSLAV